jgi:hypothetical protein
MASKPFLSPPWLVKLLKITQLMALIVLRQNIAAHNVYVTKRNITKRNITKRNITKPKNC